MIALAAKNLGDPNMSNTFMGELSLQSFGFQDQSGGGSTTAGGESMSKANISDPNGKLKEMPTVTSKVEEKTSVGSSPVDEEISAQKYLTEAEKNKEVEILLEEKDFYEQLKSKDLLGLRTFAEKITIFLRNRAFFLCENNEQ